jgi:hypothetical protein
MTPGSHHLIVFFTDGPQQPDGTLTENCGFAGSGIGPVWTYSAGTPYHEQVLPAGVGMRVGARQSLFVQMHYLNVGTTELRASVRVNGHTYAAGDEYIPAAAYVTYNTEINIPPNSEGFAEGSCAVPPEANFYALSTHSQRFSVHTEVHDGDDMVFQSDDWEHPGLPAEQPIFCFNSFVVPG